MGDLTLADYQASVLRVLDNASSTDPFISAGEHTREINRAANRMIRMYPDQFPEHNNNTWTLDITVVGNHTTSIGNNQITVTRITSADSDTSPAATNWASVTERIVAQTDEETIGVIAKGS